MKKTWRPIRKSIYFLMWLLVSAQLCWGDTNRHVALSFYSPQSDTVRLSDRWLARDKLEHLAVSAFLSGVSYSVFRDFYYNEKESSAYFSATLTFSLGLGKEFHDHRDPQGKFSYKDLVADILGICLGLSIAAR